MTPYNENKKSVVTLTDDDPTSEIDVAALQRTMRSCVDPEIEVDALTFDIEDQQNAINGRSRAELEVALNDQAQLVEELAFEVEQLQSHRRGLQAELKAREDIAKNASDEVSTERAQNRAVTRNLELRSGECQTLQRALDKANKLTERLQDKSNGLQIATKELKREIRSLKSAAEKREKKVNSLAKDLRMKRKRPSRSSTQRSSERQLADSALAASKLQLADLKAYVDGRKNDWAKLKAELVETAKSLKSSRADIAQIRQDFDERNAQLIRSREQYIRVSELLAKQKTKIRKLSQSTRDLEKALHQDARQEIDAYRIRIEKQLGDIAAKSQELTTTQTDNFRLEQYSDALRVKLQDQTSISKLSVAIRHKLESRLDSANAVITQLGGQLDSERRQNNKLSSVNENLKNDHEQEISQVRDELGSIEDRMTAQEENNKHLIADLIDSRDICSSLESQMGEVEKESTQNMRQVTRQLKKANQTTGEYERKLEIRDKTVADLLQELARIDQSRISKTLKTEQKQADVLATVEKPKQRKVDRSRVARLLIGNADGRELRFPLFKDHLTIGRTSHNDIQLNMQFISRRHAVISSDHGKTRVIDWGSKNGVFVNETKVTECILRPGDILRIGMTDFRYEEREKH